jgi:hypothetical protein
MALRGGSHHAGVNAALHGRQFRLRGPGKEDVLVRGMVVGSEGCGEEINDGWLGIACVMLSVFAELSN